MRGAPFRCNNLRRLGDGAGNGPRYPRGTPAGVLAGLALAGAACGGLPVSPSAQPVEITVALDLGADEAAYQAHAEAFADVQDAGGGVVRFYLQRGAGPANVVATVSREAMVSTCTETCGVAGAAGNLDDGRLYYSTGYWAGRRPVVTHEILHLLGLGHTDVPGDIMCYCTKDPDRRMSPGERARVREILLARYGR